MGYRVLVVDDQWETVETLAAYLISKGCEVLPAHDGDEALDVLRREREKVDVMVLDLRMPKMPGHKVLWAMNQELQLKIPVVILTSVLDWDKDRRESLRQLAMSAGGYYQFLKPTKPAELWNFIGSLLDPNHPQYVHLVPEQRTGLWAVRGQTLRPQ